MPRPAFFLFLFLFLSVPLRAADPGQVLDEFHRAAALADYDGYFATMTDEVVFLGTDGSERWQGDEFREFVRPHFETGQGWEYRPSNRRVLYSPDRTTAWFDEALSHDELGQCRGSGVMLIEEGRWKVAQYNLSVPIPNSLVMSVAEQIREQPPAPGGSEDANNIPAVEEAAGPSPQCQRKRHKTNRKAGC